MASARGIRSTALCGFVLGLLLLVLPASAHGFFKSFWGPGYIVGKNPFPTFQRLGVSVVQEDLNWSVVAPTRPSDPTDPNDPAYQWSPQLEQVIAEASKFHMRVLLQLTRAPSWANGGHASNWAPQNPADFADFATAAARRYPTVHLWMIWGEPTRRQNFRPLYLANWSVTKLDRKQRLAPHIYAQILDAAYGALKTVSAHNLVIGGCTYSAGEIHPQQWIENLRLPNGKPPRMDIYAHNPFGWREPRFGGRPSYESQVQFPDLPRLAQWIDTYLGRPLHVAKPIPIFISEWNQPTAPEKEFSWWLDESAAARYTSEALRLSRHWSRIYGFGWIELYDDPPFESSGLLTATGKRKPDFNAFANG